MTTTNTATPTPTPTAKKKTVRGARLNRRRYLEITRLLKEVIGNEKVGVERRMRAVEMLLGVYDRHDKALERKERRTPETRDRDRETDQGSTETGAADTVGDTSGDIETEKDLRDAREAAQLDMTVEELRTAREQLDAVFGDRNAAHGR
jgi:hypothetical protein